jgi:uncharacterized protein YdhG (YjbR/CyaY superfamily)
VERLLGCDRRFIGFSPGGNMKTLQAAPKTIDEYIAGFPPDIQAILEEIRRTIRKAAPDAEETIKYEMPTFILKGNLVYFAAFKNHIGFYPPVSTADPKLKKELAVYEGPKRSYKFPLDEPIPFGLISRIVKLRAKENLERAKTRAASTKMRI